MAAPGLRYNQVNAQVDPVESELKMRSLSKSMLARAGLALGLIGVLSALAFSVAQADGAVTLTTPPIDPVEQVQYNSGLTHKPVFHYIGTYPRYGAKYLQFTWKPYPFPATVHGSYRVSILQNFTPLDPQPTWMEFLVAHDWADNPAGPTFTMGPFLHAYGMCNQCPSKIVVSAETYQAVQTPGTDDWSILYSPILTDPTTPTTPPVEGAVARRVQESNLFVVNTGIQDRCDKSSGPDC